MGDKGKRFNFGSQTRFWTCVTETAAETTEVHKHSSGTRVKKSEQRSHEEEKAANKERTEEQCKNIEKGMMSRGLQHPQGSHQDPTAQVSSHRRQQWKHPDGKHSCSTPVDLVTAVAYTTTNSIKTLDYSRVARPPHKSLKAYLCGGKRLKRLCMV